MNQRLACREICQIGQRMWQRGFCAGNDGNISVRLGPDRVLCTPSGVSKGFLRPEMPVVVDMQGRPVGGIKSRKTKTATYRPTSEIQLHLAIYAKRPDIAAVIHSHAPHATAFACAREKLPMGIHPEAEFFLREVPRTDYRTPGTAAVGESCCALIGEKTNSVLLGNHGAVCFGANLIDAYGNLEMLEAYCRLVILLKQIGPPRLLSVQELAALKQIF